MHIETKQKKKVKQPTNQHHIIKWMQQQQHGNEIGRFGHWNSFLFYINQHEFVVIGNECELK